VTESLGIVVLAYGESDTHMPLVQALIDHHGCARNDIILVHNPSRPGSPWRPPAPAGVRIEFMPSNRGYAAGMNRGISSHLARGTEFILLLTHEVRLPDGAVEGLKAMLRANRMLGAVGPVLVNQDGAVMSAGFERTRATVRHRTAVGCHDEIQQVDGLDGSVILLNSTAVRSVGPLDEAYFLYFEETEYCMRLRSAGWQIGVANGISASSQPGGANRPGAHAYLMARNGLYFGLAADGGRGVVQVLVDLSLQAWRLLPKPFGRRFTDASAWATSGRRLRGMMLGIRDFLLGRSGPPPTRLLTGSDISNVGRG
jgi:GT2 family glycosyltransferase